MNHLLAALGLCCCAQVFSVVAVSGGRSLVAGHKLLAAVASLIAERGLEGSGVLTCRLGR